MTPQAEAATAIEEDFPDDVVVDGYWDDVSGGWLPAALAIEARREGVRWV